MHMFIQRFSLVKQARIVTRFSFEASQAGQTQKPRHEMRTDNAIIESGTPRLR